MAKGFFVLNWYWVVAGDATKVYSSKVGDYVPVSDATYVAWKADGTQPHAIKSELELGTYLGSIIGADLRPIPAVVLDAYKEAQSQKMTPLDVMPKVVHFVYNEVRVLQGKPEITFEQFRQAIKDKM